jgi:hypothetical protein
VLSCFSANDKTNVRDTANLVSQVLKQYPKLQKDAEKQKVINVTADLKWKDALKLAETDPWTHRWFQDNQNN